MTLDTAFSEQNVLDAFEDLQSKKNSAGPDGMLLHDVPEHWETNREAILAEMRAHTFRPGVVREIEMIQPNGKRRTIVQINALDRFILRCLSKSFQDELDSMFSDSSFAFRPERGVRAAVQRAVKLMEKGREWIAEIDVESYFDTIPHDKLLSRLTAFVKDEDLLALVSNYLHPKVIKDHFVEIKNIGILQGSPLSPVLSNLYLDPLDKTLEQSGAVFVRYCDNINIYCKNYEEAVNRLNFAKKQLEKDFGLQVNAAKTGVYHVFNRMFLGHTFRRSDENGRIYACKTKKGNREVYSRWQASAIQKVDRNYHIINDGILTKRDFTILFENEEGKRYIPIETSETLNVYSNVILSSDFLQYAGDNDLSINVFTKYGDLAGRYTCAAQQSNAKLLFRQVECYTNETVRLKIAKTIIIAAAHNMRANIRYYKQRKKHPVLEEKEKKISELIQMMNEAETVESLMLIEARARQQYYMVFDPIMEGSGFTFEKRTKRPPKDPLNAMISFGNTILYNRLATDIHKSGLEIRIAYLHSTNNRRQSLNLDLAEIFKPIIVDRVIFTLANKGMLDPALHFEKAEQDGVYLSKEGKQIFLSEMERKIYQKLEYKDETYSYDTLMKREIKAFKQFIEHGTPYKAYKYY